MIQGLLDQLAGLDTQWFLLLAFLLPFGETVVLLDVVVPGEVGLVFIGAAAAQADVSLVAVIAVGAAGAFLGDSTSWYIGHRWGVSLITRWEPVRRRLEGPLLRTEGYFDKYGGQTVFAGRFVGALRAFVPLVAGTSGMTYRRFLPWNIAASVLWVGAMVILGAVFGETVASSVDRFGLVLTGALMAVVLALVARHLIRRRRARANATGTEDSPGAHEDH
ncbi:MAG: DedA family protein [Acidimicrobiales bacterium]